MRECYFEVGEYLGLKGECGSHVARVCRRQFIDLFVHSQTLRLETCSTSQHNAFKIVSVVLLIKF